MICMDGKAALPSWQMCREGTPVDSMLEGLLLLLFDPQD
jgi:hypothetical protein